MAKNKFDIYVFAHWKGMIAPKLMGILSAHYGKGVLDNNTAMPISNTDDHLRNHGFILTNEGWVLSPAYDLNPSIDKDGLALNIDMDDNALDIELARSVGDFFRLNEKQMDRIVNEVLESVSQWEKIAKSIGISRSEQEMMQGAFRF